MSPNLRSKVVGALFYFYHDVNVLSLFCPQGQNYTPNKISNKLRSPRKLNKIPAQLQWADCASYYSHYMAG